MTMKVPVPEAVLVASARQLLYVRFVQSSVAYLYPGVPAKVIATELSAAVTMDTARGRASTTPSFVAKKPIALLHILATYGQSIFPGVSTLSEGLWKFGLVFHCASMSTQ